MLNNSHLQTWTSSENPSLPPSPSSPQSSPPPPSRKFLHYYFDHRCRTHATFDCPICIADHGPQRSSNTYLHHISPTNLNPPPQQQHLPSRSVRYPTNKEMLMKEEAAAIKEEDALRPENQQQQGEDADPVSEANEHPEQPKEKQTSNSSTQTQVEEKATEQAVTPLPPIEEESVPEAVISSEPKKEVSASEQPVKLNKASRLQRLRSRAADIVRGTKAS